MTENTEKKDGAPFGRIPGKVFVSASEDILKFMKSAFDATFENVVKIQSMNEKGIREMVEKAKELQGDSMRVVDEFVANACKGQAEYKKAVDEGFKKVEDLIKANS